MKSVCSRVKFSAGDVERLIGDCVEADNLNFLGQMIHRLNNHMGWWHDIETGEPKDLVHYGDADGMENMFNRSAVGLQSHFNSDIESAKSTMETLIKEAKEQELLCRHSTK